jgi:hypothetical protein
MKPGETFQQRELPPRTTPNGKWDAYCHVCWNAVYCLWVDKVPPEHDKCAFGDHTALTCPDATARARTAAWVAKMIREGHLTPKEKA